MINKITAKIKKKLAHGPSHDGQNLRDLILGGQDGLVNVMGIVLGVASATSDVQVVVIAGLVATFAESISMAAVAYTSMQAERAYYESIVEKEKRDMKNVPHEEEAEVREIYYKMGFRGNLLDQIVAKITSNHELWLKVMLSQELGLETKDMPDPIRSAFLVGFSAFIGSLIPMIPFFLFPTNIPLSMMLSVVMGVIVLFAAGAYKAKVTTGSWWKSGIEIAVVGTTAAIAGYLIGAWLGANPLISG